MSSTDFEGEMHDRRGEDELLRRQAQLLNARTAIGRAPEDALRRESMDSELKSLDEELTRRRKARFSAPSRPRVPAGAGAGAGEVMGAATTGIEAEVLPRMLYVPTGIVHLLGSTSTFGESRPLVSVVVRWTTTAAVAAGFGMNPGAAAKRLRVEVVVEGYSAREVQTQEVPADRGQATFDMMPAFFADRLGSVSETRRAALHVRVSQFLDGTGGEAVELERTYPIWLLARQAACVFMMDPVRAEMRDYSYALGGWVTPNEPSVLALLAGTAGADVGGFFGRQGRTEAELERQVRLLYTALANLGWRYVGFTTATPPVDGTVFQRVRLPQETLRLKAANCLDGALLFASLLEAASLEPALVLMTDHAIVAWRRAIPDGADEWWYLDTTLLGRGDFDQARKAGQAVAEVRAKMAELSGKAEHFRLWPLSDLRLRGITPLE